MYPFIEPIMHPFILSFIVFSLNVCIDKPTVYVTIIYNVIDLKSVTETPWEAASPGNWLQLQAMFEMVNMTT